jgi:hypothetical protein
MMSFEPADRAGHEHYTVLADAVDRHLAWACEFATAGDLDSAIDALRDAHAASGEVHASRSNSAG